MNETAWTDVLDRVNKLLNARGTAFTREFVKLAFGTESAEAVEKMGPTRWGHFVRRVDSMMGAAVWLDPSDLPLPVPVAVGATEKKRASLAWADTKPFNNFEGFTVKKSEVSQPLSKGLPSPEGDNSHLLKAVHGSAWLLKG